MILRLSQAVEQCSQVCLIAVKWFSLAHGTRVSMCGCLAISLLAMQHIWACIFNECDICFMNTEIFKMSLLQDAIDFTISSNLIGYIEVVFSPI